MKCIRCNSPRTIRFIDGNGVRRIYCRTCKASYPEEILLEFGQKKLFEFKEFENLVHINPRAVVRYRI
ncbi:MAG: hypothetical protein J7L39_00255 [Candidatus Aenigmarchaeota archaeon]|nr:hypothetical protein [Candidatus Aenigmarchaeota archaeon]